MSKLYRVIRRTTDSLQSTGTHWSSEVLYSGYDRDEARRIYHETKPSDAQWVPVDCYGTKVIETLCQVIEDADTDDFADDEILAADGEP